MTHSILLAHSVKHKTHGLFSPIIRPPQHTGDSIAPTKRRERSLHSTTAPCCRELTRAVLHSPHAPPPGCRSLVPNTSPTSPNTRKYQIYCFRLSTLHAQTLFLVSRNILSLNMTDRHLVASSIALFNNKWTVIYQITTRSD